MNNPKQKNKVVVLQTNYLPWKGYFDLISEADQLILYDDVQFTKNDWRNRNRIKSSSGLLWISVPVGQNISRKINEVEISDSSWQKKHWKTISLSYQKMSGFKDYKDFFEDFYLKKEWRNLSLMNEYLIKNILEFLGLKTPIQRSESFDLVGQKEDRLLDLLLKVRATDYITGPSGLNYIKKENFEAAGIALQIKKYGPYLEYSQPHGNFEHQVSIIDTLMCCGNNSSMFFKSGT